MSKIMRNGNKYGGTASSMAKDIVYEKEDGTPSNVQGEIDELNKKLAELEARLGETVSALSGTENYIMALGTASETKLITFSKQFTTMPKVTAELLEARAASGTGALITSNSTVTVSDVTKSSFKVTLSTTGTGGSWGATVSWVAEASL